MWSVVISWVYGLMDSLIKMLMKFWASREVLEKPKIQPANMMLIPNKTQMHMQQTLKNSYYHISHMILLDQKRSTGKNLNYQSDRMVEI